MSLSPEPSGVARAAGSVDAAGLLYGAIVSGSTLGAVSAHADGSTRVALSTLIVLGVYWLAHVYIHAISKQLGGTDASSLVSRILVSARDEVSVFIGGLPAIVAYVLLAAVGFEPTTAGFIALILLVALLFGFAYFGARRVGLTVLAASVEAVGAGFLGVLIIIMKALLH